MDARCRSRGERFAARAVLPLFAGLALPIPAAAEDSEKAALRTVIFGSLEAGPGSAFAASGAKRTIGSGLDESGFVLMTLSGTGLGRERAPGGAARRNRHRHVSEGAVLAGWQWMIEGGVVMALVGAEAGSERLVEGGGPGRGSRGGKVLAELWYHPTSTTLVTGTLIAGSARRSAWARASYGWQVWEGAFLGPEAALYGEAREGERAYGSARVGVHLTGLALGPVTLRLSAGVGATTGAPVGYYVGLSTFFRM